MALRKFSLVLASMVLVGCSSGPTSSGGGSTFTPPNPQQVLQAQDPRPTIIDLGPAPQSPYSPFGNSGPSGQGFYPLGISNTAEIVGDDFDRTGPPSAATWKSGKVSRLPGLNGSTRATAFSISGGGLIAGSAVSGSPPQAHAVYWKDGQVSDLGPAQGSANGWPIASTSAINDKGDAVGYFSDIYSGRTLVTSWFGAVYAPLSGVADARPVAINNKRQVLIRTFASPQGGSAIWDGGSVKNLDLLGGALNDAGVVVGSRGGKAYAVDFSTGQSYNIGQHAAAAHSEAKAINTNGGVVGILNDNGAGFPTDSSRAFFWALGSNNVIDLNTLLPANSGWMLQDAVGINSTDQVVGTGKFNGQAHGFVLSLMPLVGQYRTYVALGDSFSSGLGAGATLPRNNDGVPSICDATGEAYSWKIAGHPGVPSGSFGFYPCSGEQATDVANFSFEHQPNVLDQGEWSQMLRVGPDTKLVTFTFGGIDVGVVSVAQTCLVSRILAHKGLRPKFQPICLDQDPTITAAIQNIQSVLVSLYTEIKERAPKAQVLVLLYPHLFPTDHAVDSHCIPGSDQDVITWFNKKTDALNDAIKQSVSLSVPGVMYVDTSDAFRGHEECTQQSWVNELSVNPPNASLHPNIKGHQALASAVLRYLQAGKERTA